MINLGLQDNAPITCTGDAGDDTQQLQEQLYAELASYSFADDVLSLTEYDEDGRREIVSADYYLMDRLDDIYYYTPNDEDWGGIIAISHKHKLAHNTWFHEMDDMRRPAPYDGYRMVVVDGVMGCRDELIDKKYVF